MNGIKQIFTRGSRADTLSDTELREEMRNILLLGMSAEDSGAKEACAKVLRIIQHHKRECRCKRYIGRPLRFTYVNELERFVSALIWQDWSMACSELSDVIYFYHVSDPVVLWAVTSYLERYLGDSDYEMVQEKEATHR